MGNPKPGRAIREGLKQALFHLGVEKGETAEKGGDGLHGPGTGDANGALLVGKLGDSQVAPGGPVERAEVSGEGLSGENQKRLELLARAGEISRPGRLSVLGAASAQGSRLPLTQGGETVLETDPNLIASQSQASRLSHGEGGEKAETMLERGQNAVQKPWGGPPGLEIVRGEEALAFLDRSSTTTHEDKSTQPLTPSHDAGVSSAVQARAPGESGVAVHPPPSVSLASGVMQQILEHLNLRTWKVGRRDLRIQLHPPEMGHMRMEIGLKDHQVVLKIHVDNPLVKDLIENNLAQLRQGLQDQGLRMDRCSVTVGDHSQDPSGTGGHGHGTFGDRAVPAERPEGERISREGHSSVFRWESDHVNLFI